MRPLPDLIMEAFPKGCVIMKKRWFSMLLALCLVLTLAPAAFAADRALTVGENAGVSTGWYTFRPAESGQYGFYTDAPIITGIIEAYTIPGGADQLPDAQKTAIRAKLQYLLDAEFVEDGRQQIIVAEQQLESGRQQVEAAKQEYVANAPVVEQYKKNSEAIQNLINQYNGFMNNAEALPFGTATVEGWYQLIAKPQIAMLGIDAPASGEDFLKMWRDAEFRVSEFEAAGRQIAEAEETLRQGEEGIAAAKEQLAQMEQELAAELAALPDPNVDVSAYRVLDDDEAFVGGQDYWLYVDLDDRSITLTIQRDASGTPAASVFVDVPADAYYKTPVEWATAYGITNGTDLTHFSPDLPCTRAQIVTFLWRAAGEPESAGINPFVDVASGAYYAEAVQWAINSGVTIGTDETHFSPDAPCTRGQAVTFLHRALGGESYSGPAVFADVALSDYFYHPVLWATDYGITNGTDGIHFSPYDLCTRAQIVTFLYRALS